jgi:ketopantoate reductase
MRALVVGAGAVGQVYGHHLARGGADVAFYVRPKCVFRPS